MAETRMLPVQLTPEDLRERGEELAAKVTLLHALEDEKKEAAKAAKDRIDEVKEQVIKLSRTVRSKQEARPVEVREVSDVTRKVIEVVRLDSGEVVESRPMTPRELEDVLQQRLGFAVHEGELKQG